MKCNKIDSRWRYWGKVGFLSATLFALSACQGACNKKKSDGEGEAADLADMKGVAALVNGQKIAKDSVDKMLTQTVDRFKRAGRDFPPEMQAKLKENIMRRAIDDALIKERCTSEGVEVTSAERQKLLDEHKTRLGGEETYKDFLQRSGTNEEELANTLVLDKMRDKLAEKLKGAFEPSVQEVADFYKQNSTFYVQPELVKARHILIKVAETDPADKKEEAKKKSLKILEEVRSHKAPFAELADKYNEGPGPKNGGDLGLFPRGRMVKPFEDTVFSAKPGQVVGPIETMYGYHLVLVEEKKPAGTMSLEEAKPRIVEMLQRTNRSKIIESELVEMRKQAKYTFLDPSLKIEGLGDKEEHAKGAQN